jgi:anti-sigma B factor antagonist
MEGTPIVDLRFDEIEGVPVVHLIGEIDMSTAEEFQDRLLAALSSQAPGLILDLTQADYMDSSGLKVLFITATRLREIKRGFRIVLPESSPISNLISVSGAEGALPIDRSVDDAVKALRADTD